jgi:hypothetical protein
MASTPDDCAAASSMLDSRLRGNDTVGEQGICSPQTKTPAGAGVLRSVTDPP